MGAYLNAEAKSRTYLYHSVMRLAPAETRYYDGFVEWNDHKGRTVEDVIDLFKVVLKQLKVREAKLAERRAAAALARAAA